ncbi:Uncharacterised protein [Klebsiella variicola]|nr:Uncharacterised protein [Klebsiella variicola]
MFHIWLTIQDLMVAVVVAEVVTCMTGLPVLRRLLKTRRS